MSMEMNIKCVKRALKAGTIQVVAAPWTLRRPNNMVAFRFKDCSRVSDINYTKQEVIKLLQSNDDTVVFINTAFVRPDIIPLLSHATVIPCKKLS